MKKFFLIAIFFTMSTFSFAPTVAYGESYHDLQELKYEMFKDQNSTIMWKQFRENLKRGLTEFGEKSEAEKQQEELEAQNRYLRLALEGEIEEIVFDPNKPRTQQASYSMQRFADSGFVVGRIILFVILPLLMVVLIVLANRKKTK